MAASPWTVFNTAKLNLGTGRYKLGTSAFKGILMRASLSTTVDTTISSVVSLGAFTCTAGGGDEVVSLGNLVWSNSGSANGSTIVWDVSDAIFTASTQAISSVRYMVIYQSNGASAGTGYPLCYAALSTGSFAVSSGNTLTVQMANGGVFTLA